MLAKSLEKVIAKTYAFNHIVIVGAGCYGTDLQRALSLHGIMTSAFLDNSSNLWGKQIDGVIVRRPHFDGNKDSLYVICASGDSRSVLRTQLLNLGIPKEQITDYYAYRDYEYLSSLPLSEYQNEISDMFSEKLGYEINWKYPATYNEIINWEKLNNNSGQRVLLSDKFRVRSWVKDKIGGDYLTEVFGAWDDPAKIEYERFPNSFALKMNNGSNRNMIVDNKALFDKNRTEEQIRLWFQKKHAFVSLELHYNRINPLVYAEEFLEFSGGKYIDYKCYCFHGKVAYIHRIKNEHKSNAKALFYDRCWRAQSFNHGYDNDEEIVSAPECLEEMIELSEILSNGIEHVRVDWFIKNEKKLFFAEMTFSSWSGLVPFSSFEIDELFGRLIKGEKYVFVSV